jgi:hypothetical protein
MSCANFLCIVEFSERDIQNDARRRPFVKMRPKGVLRHVSEKTVESCHFPQHWKSLQLNRFLESQLHVRICHAPQSTFGGTLIGEKLTPGEREPVMTFEQMSHQPLRIKLIGIGRAIDQNRPGKMVHRLDEYPTLDQREIGIPVKDRLYHLFDLCRCGQRLGLVSVTTILCVPG